MWSTSTMAWTRIRRLSLYSHIPGPTRPGLERMSAHAVESNIGLWWMCDMHSVLWHCWLGGRKSIWPLETGCWGDGVVICLARGANDLLMVQLMPMPPHITSCFSKMQNVYCFWYRLTHVVLEKKPSNECYCFVLCRPMRWQWLQSDLSMNTAARENDITSDL